MRRRNTLRTLIASFLLMLATGTLMVKSVHCVLIPHDTSTTVLNGHAVVFADKSDHCPICSFDFFPVILHSLKVLPDVSSYFYTESSFCIIESPEKQPLRLFSLRAPPAIWFFSIVDSYFTVNFVSTTITLTFQSGSFFNDPVAFVMQQVCRW